MSWWVEERKKERELERKKLEMQGEAAAEDSSVPVEEIKGLHPL